MFLNNIKTLAYTINLQIFIRCFTSGINLLLARFLDPIVFGTAYVSWGLLETLSLCLLKEAFRRVLLRTTSVNHNIENINHFMSSPILHFGCSITCILSVFLSCIWGFYLIPIKTSSFNYGYTLSTLCFILGNLYLQILAEPYLMMLIVYGHIKAKATVEGLALFIKTCSICIIYLLLILFKNTTSMTMTPLNLGFITLGLSQLIYGATLYFGFSYILKKNVIKKKNYDSIIHPNILHINIQFYRRVWSLLSSEEKCLLKNFLFIALEKIVLNEIERVVLIIIYPTTIWPVYALVTNLGGIMCRLIFAPLEELATIDFSTSIKKKILSSESVQDQTNNNDTTTEEEEEEKEYASTNIFKKLDTLKFYFNLEGSIGLAALCLATPLAGTGIWILYGSHWATLGAHFVFKMYCIQLFIMAMNGPCEAFMYSVGNTHWLRKLQWVNIIICFIGILLAFFLRYIAMKYPLSTALFITHIGYITHVTDVLNHVILSEVLLLCSIFTYGLRILVFIRFLWNYNQNITKRDIMESKIKEDKKISKLSTLLSYLIPFPILCCHLSIVVGGIILRYSLGTTGLDTMIGAHIKNNTTPIQFVDIMILIYKIAYEALITLAITFILVIIHSVVYIKLIKPTKIKTF